MQYPVERDFDGKKLVIETGKFAAQSSAAVTVRCGDSIILATVCVAPHPRADIDFLPLTVDYEERLYAAGKIPGSFFRREGRPTQEAVLFGRLSDRPLRPLFPKGFYNDVQIVITVLSADKENPPEILGIVGASAALAISEIPFAGPVGATRVGHINGSYVVNPTFDDINQGDLSVVVASTKDAVMMVEAAASEASEEVVLEGIRKAQEANNQVIEMIEELVRQVGKPKIGFQADTGDQDLESEVDTLLNGRLSRALEAGLDKNGLDRASKELEAEVVSKLEDLHPREQVAASFESVLKKLMRSRILDKGVRPDGRGLKDIRLITCEVGVLPRTHGSGLFTRGETQVLTITTLAATGMRQTLDTLSPIGTKRFLHHYNFPPYSTGEVKRMGSAGRREIGHGALAERAIEPVIPSEEDFPYTIRLVSEVLSSNGSTSMASVCGSTLALMDAGVPVSSPVAGIAMGLVIGGNGRHAVLTDIQGLEDHLGDMDFKVAGTARGINALQLDVKVAALSHAVLEGALEQAKEARMVILEKIQQVISEPRPETSPYAPKVIRIVIPVDKIGALIGPGGRNIRAIQEETGATIDTEDDGTVVIGSSDEAMLKRARSRVEALTREIAVGDIFTGKVTRLTTFGAFVELTPGKDGLLRSGEMSDGDGLKMGQELTVLVKEIDPMGRINLSQRDLYGENETEEPQVAARPAAPSQGRPPQGGNAPGFRGPGGGPPRSGPGGAGQSRRPFRPPFRRPSDR